MGTDSEAVRLNHVDIESVKKLIKLGKDFMAAPDLQTKSRVRGDMLSTARTLIDVRFDKIIRLDAQKPSYSIEAYKDHLAFLTLNLETLHAFQHLTPDFIKWVISKLILSRTCTIVNDRFGDLLQQHILSFSRLLSANDSAAFLIHLVKELTGMTRGVSEVCMLEKTEDVPTQYHLTIPLVDEDGNSCRTAVYHSLLYLLQHGPFEFGQLNQHQNCLLWVALLSVHDIDNMSLRITCVRLWQRLFSLDLSNWVVFTLSVERMLSIEKYLYLDCESSGSPREGSDALREAHTTCIKVVCDLLSRHWSTKSLPQILNVGVLTNCAITAAQQFIEYKTAGPSRLEVFVFTICDVLAGIRIDESRLELIMPEFQRLVNLVKTLVANFIRVFNDEDILTKLLPSMEFLLMFDELTGTVPMARINWLESLCNEKRISLSQGAENCRVHSITVRRAIAMALSQCRSPLAKDILPKILPSQEYLIKIVDGASAPNCIPLLQALLGLVGDMTFESPSSPDLSAAFLSFPWLADHTLLLSSKRHHKSMPLLKELLKHVKKCAGSINDDLRVVTLPPLAWMRGKLHAEWRREIFLAALKSPSPRVVQVALVNVVGLVSSAGLFAFASLMQSVLDLTQKSVDLVDVLRSVSQSICASCPSTNTTRVADQNGYSAHVDCQVCRAVAAGDEPPGTLLSLPGSFLGVVKSILDPQRLRECDKQTRIETAALISATLCHCGHSFATQTVLDIETVKASLSLITDVDEEVRNEFIAAFKVIVRSDSLLEALTVDIQNTITEYTKEVEEGMYTRMMQAVTPFLVICVLQSTDTQLSEWAFEEHYRMLLRSGVESVVVSMRSLVKDVAVKEAPSEPGISHVFIRRMRALTEILVTQMLDDVNEMTMDGSSQEDITNELDRLFNYVEKIFRFDSTPAMLASCWKYAASLLLLPESHNVHASETVLRRIAYHMDKTNESIAEESFPLLLSRRITHSHLRNVSDETFLLRFSARKESFTLANNCRFRCNLHALYVFSINPTECLNSLEKLNASLVDHLSLTNILKINCEYLGQLMNFRRALIENEYFELRPMLLNSLIEIIRHLDQDFIDLIAPKLMIVIGAATKLGEVSVPVWCAFVNRLNAGVLVNLLPQILITLQPLLQYESTNELLDIIFKHKGPLAVEQSESLERTAMVLLDNGLNNSGSTDSSSKIGHYLRLTISADNSPEKVIKGCIRMLVEECETVGKVVLQKLQSILNGTPIADELAAELVPALLHTLRRCSEPEVRLRTAECLGRLGAVDPGRLGLSSATHRHTAKPIVFVDDNEFYVDLIEKCWRVYSAVLNPHLIQHVEYCIQDLLVKLVGSIDSSGIMDKLSAECRRDIEPLRVAKLKAGDDRSSITGRPLVDHVKAFPDWLYHCFLMGVSKVRQYPMKAVFEAIRWIAYIRDTVFTRELLPQLVIRLILENHEEMINTYAMEMESVLRRVLESDDGWVQMAAHVVFSIMDTLERYIIKRLQTKGRTDSEGARTADVVKRLVSIVLPDGRLLVVAAAEKCQCLYRALRWCEQYSIQKDAETGANIFDRQNFYDLERFHTQLQNVDGVLGAYECLAANTVPTADERILALEANGDYSEALPLYSFSTDNKELQLIKCLLQLNQPELALSAAESSYEKYRTHDDSMDVQEGSELMRSLEASQVEATWHLRDWPKLEEIVQKRDLVGTSTSWGASCASIMCAVKKREPTVLHNRLRSARERLVERLTAMTIEHADTYAQVYKYIAQLHILEEVDSATRSLGLLDDDPCASSQKELSSVLKQWQVRSDNAVQCTSVLEPILRVRRELLQACRGPVLSDAQSAVSQLLIQSCRLARQAGHLQIAWTFLVEAKALDINPKDVGMEEARFEFQKGNQQQAISLLTKLLNGKLGKITEMFSQFVAVASTTRGQQGKTDELQRLMDVPREDRAAFAEVQLLRAEYIMKAGAAGSNELYKIYDALRQLDVPSEDLYYRVAVFCDSMYTQSMLDTDTLRMDLVGLILKTYIKVLKQGRTHLFHAMPRLLTLWLDVTLLKTEGIAKRTAEKNPSAAELNAKDIADVDSMNKIVLDAAKDLEDYVFYSAFPQLISRITHPNESVFQTLKSILANLMCAYPHQCLWQSIAVYRTGPWGKGRQERCTQIYNVACNKDRRLASFIDQYDYIAAILIQLGECKMSVGLFRDLPKKFPALHLFFTTGHMETNLLMGAKERKLVGSRKVQQPCVMVPLTEMLEHALPTLKVQCFSQIDCDLPGSANVVDQMGALPEAFIESFKDEYLVLKSMQRPKRISVRTGDGRSFYLMCKPGDELRKDCRFMEVCRMANTMMRQNADARRRQLMVRTFSVIPLQANGGILEWLPNLMSYRDIVQPLCVEKTGRVLPTETEWFDNWNSKWAPEEQLRRFHTFFYPAYPLVMAEWFRRQFADPASWHAARSAYARSTAVMSIIGFVMGLGDRHGENVSMDIKEGCIVHVDFNLLFNKGEDLPVKEVVPFRLTRNMINGLGPTGVEGGFRKACEATLRVMRDNKETLLTVIQTFVHDPLLEWTESRAQQDKDKGKRNKASMKPMNPAERAADAVALIGRRLNGHIVTTEVYRHMYHSAPMGVEGQVNKLIEMATDEKLLSQMYVGWGGFM